MEFNFHLIIHPYFLSPLGDEFTLLDFGRGKVSWLYSYEKLTFYLLIRIKLGDCIPTSLDGARWALIAEPMIFRTCTLTAEPPAHYLHWLQLSSPPQIADMVSLQAASRKYLLPELKQGQIGNQKPSMYFLILCLNWKLHFVYFPLKHGETDPQDASFFILTQLNIFIFSLVFLLTLAAHYSRW